MQKNIDSIIQNNEDYKLNKYLESEECICEKCLNVNCPYDYDIKKDADVIDEICKNGECKYFEN